MNCLKQHNRKIDKKLPSLFIFDIPFKSNIIYEMDLTFFGEKGKQEQKKKQRKTRDKNIYLITVIYCS